MFQKAKKVKKYIKVALWGDAKQGKTEFALSFPKPAVIDTEKGSLLFADKFDFDVEEVIRWKDVAAVLKYVRDNPGKHETLVIDSLTPLYKDLVDEVVQYVQNKRGKETLSQGDWGVIKRRWGAFLRFLLELPMHVVLTMRSKDEYETRMDPATGKEESHKTGQNIPDIDRSTIYQFDYIFSCKAILNKKTKDANYIVTVDGTRPGFKKFQEFDVTGKKGFDVVFGSLVKLLTTGAPLQSTASVSEIVGMEGDVPAAGIAAAEPLAVVEEINKFFGADLNPDILKGRSLGGTPATAEDLKILFTRAGQVQWDDGSQFSKDDAKSMIRWLYGIDSSKELRQHEVDFVYNELGKVLAGHSALNRDDKGVVRIVPREILSK